MHIKSQTIVDKHIISQYKIIRVLLFLNLQIQSQLYLVDTVTCYAGYVVIC